ncbi:MAG: hypothetical protein ACMG6E_06330 [Candidatus Roizmanbacteria bacterium]
MVLLLLFSIHPVPSQLDLLSLLVEVGHIHHVVTHFVGVVLVGLLETGVHVLLLISLLIAFDHGELMGLINHASESLIA